ncbi:MAG TPA: arginine deiminase-related protein [Steroidobacteraceae bacterium]|nr:arginine deiminase-related protein [Steroidobacteraceae bacterium]
MVRPAAFGFNPETAKTNTFQRPVGPAPGAAAAARGEFEQLVRALASEGVSVCAVEDTPSPVKPDAVFPNNWVSFHQDGTLVLYPLQSASRRSERRQEVIDAAIERLAFKVSRLVDLTPHERHGRFLEGTGSLVLDHVQRVAYACASPRTHPQLVAEWARQMEYEPVIFDAADRAGVSFYHTNVLLSIGARAVVVGAEAIAPADRERVLARLKAGGREVIEIGQEALAPETFERLSGSTDALVAVPVPTIERLGGGSVRCMLAEVFRSA